MMMIIIHKDACRVVIIMSRMKEVLTLYKYTMH